MRKKARNFLENKNMKLIATGLAILLVAIGATYAWWTASVEMKQDVTMGKLSIQASFEELSDTQGYEPGTYTEMPGTIRNVGDIPAMVKIDNSSQIKFAYSDDQLTIIPSNDRQFVQDIENSVKLSFAPTSGDYLDNEDVYWYTDSAKKIYVLLEVGASLDVTTVATYDGSVMGNKYQQSKIKVGALLKATQVIDGALSQEFGVTFEDLMDLEPSYQSGSSKRALSRGQARLQELASRESEK